MTTPELIYIIGAGVAFIMGIIGLTAENNSLPKAEQCYAGVIFGALLCAIVSWAVPIWWIGMKIYTRMNVK